MKLEVIGDKLVIIRSGVIEKCFFFVLREGGSRKNEKTGIKMLSSPLWGGGVPNHKGSEISLDGSTPLCVNSNKERRKSVV